jgi:uncharacterized UPF0160 family protein
MNLIKIKMKIINIFKFKKAKKLVTHNGSFHADDIFTCATLLLMLGKKGEKAKIFRTRDEEIIKTGDYVFDIGGIYDADKNLFDHHQIGGAGKRENGIGYSSFGLVWKKFGKEICDSERTVKLIDTKLVAPIDAGDNGIDLVEKKNEIFPYFVQDVFASFRHTALEEINNDKVFEKLVGWAKEILSREIKKFNDQEEIFKIIQDFYKNSEDKRLIIIDKPRVSRYEIWDALLNFSEPLFAVYGKDDDWGAVAMRKDMNSFENRKYFPKAWAGMKNQELQEVTGVQDAVFCHNSLFLVGAKSKEGAIKLAQIALEAE